MIAGFDRARFSNVLDTYEKWWDRTLGRPLIQLTHSGRKADFPKPAQPYFHFTSFYDLSVTPKEIVDVWQHAMTTNHYLGDAFPSIWPNFGAGAIAAFMGCELHNTLSSHTTWFHPKGKLTFRERRFLVDFDNPWYRRTRDIMEEAVTRFDGCAQIGMTDLGGNLDILSSFRPGEDMLLDLYDDPEAVKLRTWDAHAAWFAYFDKLNETLRPGVLNPGYTAWTPILSRKSYYMLQCDFCYMIGPDMFDEFVKPELAAACSRIEHAFYHLDGPGQLPHLDSLLEIPDLDGVQWIPGAGVKPTKEWLDVYEKIHKAGKLIHLHGDAETLDLVADRLGTAEGIFFSWMPEFKTLDEGCKFLEKWGVPAGL